MKVVTKGSVPPLAAWEQEELNQGLGFWVEEKV